MTKIILFVSLFAILALKLSNAAPVPEDEKKEEVSVVTADLTSQAPAAADVKSEAKAADVSAAVKTEAPAVTQKA